MENILIQNAQIATSADVFDGDVLLQEGKIAKIGSRLAAPEGTRVIDATGKILMPGGVDVHTHFDLDVGFTRASDDFYTGTVAAAFGGTTTVVDHMAFGPKNCRLTRQPKEYHKLARRAVIDYGFHGVIQHVNEEVLEDMKLLRDEEGITSFKIYLTYDFKLEDADVLTVLTRAKELGLVICAHCEDDAMLGALRKKYLSEGKLTPHYHPLSRPAECEEVAIYRFLMLAKVA
ncbi:MAG: amidohydrolase family protein, partial [Oscillospiraceae bacterium]